MKKMRVTLWRADRDGQRTAVVWLEAQASLRSEQVKAEAGGPEKWRLTAAAEQESDLVTLGCVACEVGYRAGLLSEVEWAGEWRFEPS
jgi:hypothetical protein